MFSKFELPKTKPTQAKQAKQVPRTRQQDLDTLNLTEPVTMEDIKKAFRLLALQYHPDKNPLDSKKYIEIREAYDRLK
jgi:DnaJ-class molecular chaperone